MILTEGLNSVSLRGQVALDWALQSEMMGGLCICGMLPMGKGTC